MTVAGALHVCSKHCFPTARLFAESLVTCFILFPIPNFSGAPIRPFKTASIGTYWNNSGVNHDFHGLGDLWYGRKQSRSLAMGAELSSPTPNLESGRAKRVEMLHGEPSITQT